MEIVYCPTEQMLADFFTKPLQGSLFRRLKAVVMGQHHISTLKEIPPVASQERVEESKIEESKIPDNDENATDGQEPDGQRTDVLVPAWRTVENKRKRSYSDVAKGRVKFQPRVSSKFESERRRRLTPLTLRQ
jgi:hypothetical protein